MARFPENAVFSVRRLLAPVVLAVALLTPLAAAEAGEGAETDFRLDAGYRTDRLNWNIADSDGSPNVLSELTWNNLDIIEVKGTARFTTGYLYLRAYGDYGKIVDGDNQDSDYLGDDRTLEFSRSNNASDNGEVWDVSGGAGVAIPVAEGLKLMPLGGYSYHRQHLKITDGVQTIPATGPFSGLDSSYMTNWYGPWAGADLLWKVWRLAVRGSFEYHFLTEYFAEANWNLRSDFKHPVSFEHEADGRGVVASVGVDAALLEWFSLKVDFDYQDWRADEDGVDRTFFTSGAITEQPLNEANWESWAVLGGFNITF